MHKPILFITFFLLTLPLHSQFLWIHTDGPFGINRGPLSSNDQYAFVPGGGDFFFRTSDGWHWEKLDFDLSDDLEVYKDTLVNFDYVGNENIMHVSVDNGSSWITKDLPPKVSTLSSFAITSFGLFAQDWNYLFYKSNDLGDTWDTIPAPINTFFRMELFEDWLYLSTGKRMWRSENGDDWHQILLPVESIPLELNDDFIVRDSHIVFVSESFLFYSHDLGESWQQQERYSAFHYDKLCLVDTTVYAYFDNDLFESHDYGETWDIVYADFNYLFSFTFTSFQDDLLVSSYELGVLRIDDATGNFVQANEGMGKSFMFGMYYGAGKIWTNCGSGIFSFDVATQTWDEQIDLPFPNTVYTNISANDLGWVVTTKDFGDTLLLSKNQGAEWTKIFTGKSASGYYLLGENILDFTHESVFRSTDSGANWDELFPHVQKFPVAFQGNYFIVDEDSIYVTADDGLTWSSLPNELHLQRVYAYEDQLYGLGGDPYGYLQLYLSKDMINWTPAQDGFPDIPAFDFYEQGEAFFFRDAQYHYAFLNEDHTWISPVDVIDWTFVQDIPPMGIFLIHDAVIYAGSRGMYKAGITDPYITGVKDLTTQDDLFTLSPNPADDIVTIEVDPSINQHVNVELMTPSGNVLFSDKINPGERRLAIPVYNLIPGIYFVTCSVNEVSSTKSFFKN